MLDGNDKVPAIFGDLYEINVAILRILTISLAPIANTENSSFTPSLIWNNAPINNNKSPIAIVPETAFYNYN
jgi:hypothetical protein